MKVIGLTGGIGSGKSTVARLLAELGAQVIDADKLGHEVFKQGTEAWREVIATFGNEILTSSNEIDRRKLGELVFNKPELLQQLNTIMHPRILEIAKAKLEDYRRKGAKVVVLEATLLVEAGWTSLVDEVWVTISSKNSVTLRLNKQRGLSEAESLERIRSQTLAEERVKHADVIIDNEGSINELRACVEQLWRRLNADKDAKD